MRNLAGRPDRRACTPAAARTPTRAFRRAVAAVVLPVQLLAGCYQYVPAAGTAMPVGSSISVGVNDQGRLALTEPVGPGVRRLGGQLVASTDSTVVLAVASVDYVDFDTTVRWAGQRVTLSRNFINDVRERRLSRSRTWLLAGLVTVGAVVASTLAITGFGSDGGSDRPGPDPGQQQ